MSGSDIQAQSGVFDGAGNAFDEADRLIAGEVIRRRASLQRPMVVGLCGAQGSGKSTSAGRIAQRLEGAGCRTTVLSIDDFYMAREARAKLAARVHPLLVTRGVPGTHDVELCLRAIDELTHGQGTVELPVFDKLADTRAPRSCWRRVNAPVDVVLFEGWCVGARPMPWESLAIAVNELERQEDADGQWRLYINSRLADEYQTLFDQLDLTILLRPPGFASVHRWRSEQEADLAPAHTAARLRLNSEEIARFIAHYERLTLWILHDQAANIIVEIDEYRVPIGWRVKSP